MIEKYASAKIEGMVSHKQLSVYGFKFPQKQLVTPSPPDLPSWSLSIVILSVVQCLRTCLKRLEISTLEIYSHVRTHWKLRVFVIFTHHVQVSVKDFNTGFAPVRLFLPDDCLRWYPRSWGIVGHHSRKLSQFYSFLCVASVGNSAKFEVDMRIFGNVKWLR